MRTIIAALCVLALVVTIPAMIIAGRCEDDGRRYDDKNKRRD